MIDCINSNGMSLRPVVGCVWYVLCSGASCICWPVVVRCVLRCGRGIGDSRSVLLEVLTVDWSLYIHLQVKLNLFLGMVLVAGRFNILFLDCRFPRWG